jgi:hypothetical protein
MITMVRIPRRQLKRLQIYWVLLAKFTGREGHKSKLLLTIIEFLLYNLAQHICPVENYTRQTRPPWRPSGAAISSECPLCAF